MRITTTGNITMHDPKRWSGTYQIAYSVITPSGKTGTALLHYEWDGRDVMCEYLLTTPEIADEMREYIEDMSPVCFPAFVFPDKEQENTNAGVINDAISKATTSVYGN